MPTHLRSGDARSRLEAVESKDGLPTPRAQGSFGSGRLSHVAQHGEDKGGESPQGRLSHLETPGCREMAEGNGASLLPIPCHLLRPGVCPLWPSPSSEQSLAVKCLKNARA